MSLTIYTIGHSNHPMEHFVELLSKHEIEVVVDVRSAPYSKFNPQFNKEELKNCLQARRLKYLFLGQELGARTNDKTCYRNGQVQFDKLAQTTPFKEGIGRVLEGAKKYTVALMCAEKDPLDCHRAILVARELEARHATVVHILSDGSIAAHREVLDELRSSLGLQEPDMFRDEAQTVDEAYAKQAEKIAYRADSEASAVAR